MSKYFLLSVFQYAIVTALVIIGATFIYAIGQDSMSTAAMADVPEESSLPLETNDLSKKGKTVWNANGCGACHNKSMKDDATGPALAGVTERWAGEPREHLYGWIRNSIALAESGNSARAAEMIDWHDSAMSNFTHLSDSDIEGLLAYIDRR